MGQEKGEMALLDLEMHDAYSKFPEEMNYSLVFPKNSFKWDNKNKAYITKGHIWVGNIYKTELNSFVDGYIIIEKGNNSDILTIYLLTEFEDEYYFQYKNSIMKAWSTIPEFTTVIKELSEGKKRVNPKEGGRYKFTVASDNITEKFLKNAKKKY